MPEVPKKTSLLMTANLVYVCKTKENRHKEEISIGGIQGVQLDLINFRARQSPKSDHNTQGSKAPRHRKSANKLGHLTQLKVWKV
jgi:hypothetical protein